MMNSQVSIAVNRVSVTPMRYISFEESLTSNFNSMQNLTIKPNAFIMSKSARRRIQDRVLTMFQVSLPRTKITTSKKMINDFRCAFITLTLPSKQKHTDKEVKSMFLDQFLQELRQHYNLQNYVWKAELQKNKNIHFHIVTDVFVQFHALRKRWNRILEKGGYISRYRDSMQSLSFNDYYTRAVRYDSKLRKSTALDRYTRGLANNWSDPNSVDVKNIRTAREMGVYLSKYVSKPVDSNVDLERGKDFGRAWFCSRSVSNLVTQLKGTYSEFSDEYNEILNSDGSKEFVGDFYSVVFFNISSLSKRLAGYIESWLRYYNARAGYFIEGYVV